MTLNLPSRQLVRSVQAACQSNSRNISRRTFITTPTLFAERKSDGKVDLAALKKLSEENAARQVAQQAGPEMPRQGSLASSSIFNTGGPSRASQRGQKDSALSVPKGTRASAERKGTERDPNIMAKTLIPLPGRRARWQRKMVIRALHRRGRFTDSEMILRTERSSTSASHLFKTSMKKLNPLARQIAGKTIDDAILQMRFSKKKAAKDVKEHLEHARNEAIVKRGMGLGAVKTEGEGEEAASTTPEFKPAKIQLKDGKWKTITDPTSIYIDQAWVSKGPYGREFDHRARGQIYIMRPPHTGITVQLKEEKTRLREHQEREAKALRKRKEKMWTQLKDRKITAQRQWYSW